MFKNIFSFEIKYRIKRPATYAYFGIFFLFALLTMITGDGFASEKVYVNAPYAISLYMIILSIFGTMVASAIMGVPIYRDIEHKTYTFFFSYPIKPKQYLLGRYLGSFVVMLFVFSSISFGTTLGAFLSPIFGIEKAERFTDFSLMAHLVPASIFLIPNLFFTGTIFFCLVAITKNVRATYIGSILLFIAYLLGLTFAQDIEKKDLVDLLDPFALSTFRNESRYWTVDEQNTKMVVLAGNLLWNRIIWVGFSLVLLITTLFSFKFENIIGGSGKKKKVEDKEAENGGYQIQIPAVLQNFSQSGYLSQMFRLGRLEFSNIIKDIYFLAILLGGVIFLFLDAWFGQPTYGTPAYPLTYNMLEVKDFNFGLFVLIIIIFYTGEAIHREKTIKFSSITDALPVPNWVSYGSKFLAMFFIVVVLVTSILISGILVQTFKGYFNYELGMYLKDLYLITLPDYLILMIMAFFIHILVNSKFLGHVVVIGIWLLIWGITVFAELNYNLAFYGYKANYRISDMNGFGHFPEPLFWFNFYWLSFGVILLIIGTLLWSRGTSEGFKTRMKVARTRFSSPILIGLITFAFLWVSSGAFIYYNVSVLNTWRSTDGGREYSANYEKKYKKYERVSQPKIIDAFIEADIFPKERKVNLKGKFVIKNKTRDVIDTIFLLNYSPIEHTEIKEISFDNVVLEPLEYDELYKFGKYVLKSPLMPGDSIPMQVEIEAYNKGFVNDGFTRELVYNGTFFNSSLFPSFGYNAAGELSSDKYREEYGLPEKDDLLPPQDDPYGRSTLLFVDDADLTRFEAILSTEPDQIAIAPGYLQKEWMENDRKFYHYKMDSKIQFFFNFVSARFELKEDFWIDPQGDTVKIQLFYQKGHDYNLDRFIGSAKHSLEYFTNYFGPYQHQQIRFLEFPRYAGFAQSFPNTVPYTESFGWVGDFSDPEDFDYSYFITSHEIAHQWWGHQIAPSFTQGSNSLSESMAEYAALMVAKEKYGIDLMKKFLRYELDRYLRGRANESKKENDLLTNNNQGYILYQKGGLVLYALQDYIGEDSLNSALKLFVEDFGLKEEPPFPTTGDLYEYIKKVVPDSLQYFLEDGYEKIALYENRGIEATYQKTADEKYKIKLTVSARKFYADSLGKETEYEAMNDLIEIGIMKEETVEGMKALKPLYLEKYWLTPGEHSFEIIVDELPNKVGIDPYNKLIDRNPEDNLIGVEEED